MLKLYAHLVTGRVPAHILDNSIVWHLEALPPYRTPDVTVRCAYCVKITGVKLDRISDGEKSFWFRYADFDTVQDGEAKARKRVDSGPRPDNQGRE